MSLFLHGYRYSVYVRIARLVLAEKGIPYERVEVDPFDPARPAGYLALHPFGRVPTLAHDTFVLYETAAIVRYVDRAFDGPALQPREPKAAARMDQILGIADSYAYWPFVRQVFAHDVFRRRTGAVSDPAAIDAGLAAAAKVLDALEALMVGHVHLVGPSASLADFHLGAMMAYLDLSPRGGALIAGRPRLAAWWQVLRRRASFAATDPGLPVTQA